jgi:site-specific recombinase XerD
MLLCSAELPVLEGVQWQVEDIDPKRRLIELKGADGRKDRHALLSDVCLKKLRKYCRE